MIKKKINKNAHQIWKNSKSLKNRRKKRGKKKVRKLQERNQKMQKKEIKDHNQAQLFSQKIKMNK